MAARGRLPQRQVEGPLDVWVGDVLRDLDVASGLGDFCGLHEACDSLRLRECRSVWGGWPFCWRRSTSLVRTIGRQDRWVTIPAGSSSLRTSGIGAAPGRAA